MWWMLVGAVLVSVYPLYDLLAPGPVIRRQIESTERQDSELGRRVPALTQDRPDDRSLERPRIAAARPVPRGESLGRYLGGSPRLDRSRFIEHADWRHS